MCQMHFPRASLQVRATGPVNKYTRQPVKGRKAGGGVRFGEMERDGLLSHGSSFLLRDRCRLCVLFYPCGSRAGGLGAFVSCRSLYLWLTLDQSTHDLLLSRGVLGRLMTCSDITTADVCKKCGSIIATTRLAAGEPAVAGQGAHLRARHKLMCVSCQDGSHVVCVRCAIVLDVFLSRTLGKCRASC